MPDESSKFEELRAGLMQAIVSCRAEPGEKAVHGLRAGTRRLDALLRKVLEDHPGAEGLHRESKGALKQLGKVRKMAGSVRDLDVQRKLAEEIRDEMSERKSVAVREDVAAEYERLDGYLKRRRERNADELGERLTRCELKVERALERMADEIKGLSADSPSPLVTARGWMQRCGSQVGQLNEGNLHKYRKRTKAARYIAELQTSPTAKRLAARLRGVQDAIGKWHDWELLSLLAEDVVGKDSQVVSALTRKRSLALHAALRKANGKFA
jgi:CHAD domain-containing protein